VRTRFGTTQVCEYRLTQAEVDALVIENVRIRCNPSYDFDHPVLLRVKDERGIDFDYVVRFIQRAVAQDGEERHANFKSVLVKEG
jgi:hypothetical protein